MIIVETFRGLVDNVFVDGKSMNFEVKDHDDKIKVLECDEELIKQSGGDLFFVRYDEDTKIKTFKTEKDAYDFKNELGTD